MSKCDKIHLTEFDIATCGTGFQLIKAYLPYIDGSEQRLLAIFIRMAELMKTIEFYRDMPCPSPLSRSVHSPEHIAAEIKDYCSPKDGGILSLMANYQNINEMMKMYSAASGMMSDASGLFGSFTANAPSESQDLHAASDSTDRHRSANEHSPRDDAFSGGAPPNAHDGATDNKHHAATLPAGDMLSRFLTPEQQKLYEQYTDMLG